MTTRRLAIVPALLGALALAGCINTVQVEKFTGSQKGFRYSLPRPYIMVTPRADGGIDVQPLMLPDTDNEYVVTTFSFLSSYKYDYAFEHGLLKSVTNKQDASALAAQIVTNTGAVMKARADAALEAEKEIAKRRQDAEKAVRDARLEYEQAAAELKALQDLKADTKDAEVKLARAKAKRDALEKALAASSYNLPNAPDPTKIAAGHAWGPLLYAIIETPRKTEKQDDGTIIVKYPGTLTLKAVEPQIAFRTISLPAKQSEAGGSGAAKPAALKLELEKPGPFKSGAGGRIVFQIKTDKQFSAVDTKGTILVNTSSGITFLPNAGDYKLERTNDGRTIEVTIGPNVPSGPYTITPSVKLQGVEDFTAPATVPFTISR